MPYDDRPPHDEEPVLVGVRRSGIPSDVAQSRLSTAFRGRADAYRQDAAVDLTLVDALLRMDQPEAAARQLDDHRASLHAMARDLQVVVADAAVEREAEAVYQACAEAMARPATNEPTVRRRLLAMAGAAAVMLALVLPTGRFVPRTTLASLMDRDQALDDQVTAARDRLEAARFWARLAREGGDVAATTTTTTASPRARALVRDKVRSILADSGVDQAAGGGTAEIASLDEHRAKRHADGDGPHASGGDDDTLATVTRLTRPPGGVPGPQEPLKSGMPVETDAPDAEAPDAEVPEADGSQTDVSLDQATEVADEAEQD